MEELTERDAELTEMEEQLATYALLCATVPEFGLYPQLVEAMRRGDKKEFRSLLCRAFWILACQGLEHPRSRELWTEIVSAITSSETKGGKNAL